ncbi:hypothetical protein [Paractinoplanes atraurantiacus]|uniref:Uncharacterized protein n=1 Tax=Paractinoplanes atraurantiacus TaxID=1036182 RepID=A0A285H256_9ACTN|nr:hypothetical protein [Actinoplanes atraurantiacus]SNY29980.1 hypothetical protein SAMN05421748_103333 [Actinoplanes atraurantiacus]
MPDRDDDLIAELRDLATWLETPEPADQRAAVRTRLAKQTSRRWSWVPAKRPNPWTAAKQTNRPAPWVVAKRANRWRAWGAGVLAALAAAVIAVAPARAAVVDVLADVLRVAGIEVRREAVPPTPAVSPSPLPDAGSISLGEARKMAKFPAALGDPERVEVYDQRRVVSLFYRGGTIRLDQFDGSAAAFLKQAGQAEWTDVGGALAVWLPGPHTLTYYDRSGVERSATARLATPTLIWDTNGTTYRLEGFTDLAEARRVALSVQ